MLKHTSIFTLQEHLDYINNLDVSVVIPFYKKMEAFKTVFPRNRKYFERNGIEVVLVLDCKEEKEELIDYIKTYPFVNWKIVYNHKKHGWRNPSKPINVGIKHATKKYIMVCSPESEFYTDAILQMREMLEYYPEHYALGTVCFASFEDTINKDNIQNYPFLPYGSIMVEKKYLEAIGGYDETLNKWGGDDDNVRARLELSGIEELILHAVKLIHREEKIRDIVNQRKDTPLEHIQYWQYPSKKNPNETWGEDFNRIIYDWSDNKYAFELLNHYLSNSFLRYKINKKALKKNLKMVLLVQSYNEASRIHAFLDNITPYFDAIVWLDDESTDRTYELANHEKIVIKVQKKRTEFNDLENRNTLLDIASFLKCEWLCYIDVDQLIDERFSDFSAFINDEHTDSVFINQIQLWDDENTYNSEYPFPAKGMSPKHLMFRNIGHSQIVSRSGKLHFAPVPFRGRALHVPILIKHYGNITKEMRQKKYDFYKIEDTQKSQSSYEHLLKKDPEKKRVDQITLKDLITEI